MDLPSAGQLAKRLIDEHKLARRGWTFAFNRGKRTLGLCNYDKKTIELSVHFVTRNDEPAVRDTVLHEIAHAIAGPRAGHGPKWVAACERIGAIPNRTCSDAAMPKGRYLATCPNCNHQHHRHRRPVAKGQYYCHDCGPTRGSLEFKLTASVKG